MKSCRLTYRIVQRLRAPGEPLSRNRHFSVFDSPEGRHALRIHRRVRGVEHDLLAHGPAAHVSVTPEGGNMLRVAIDLPRLRLKRTSLLTREELDILLDSAAGDLLREATGRS